jgi:hypothetical protein
VFSSSIQADPSLRDKQPNWQDLVQQQWRALFDRAAHLDLPQEVPSHLMCPLTMEVGHKGRGGGGRRLLPGALPAKCQSGLMLCTHMYQYWYTKVGLNFGP